jgi:hypothetical protein
VLLRPRLNHSGYNRDGVAYTSTMLAGSVFIWKAASYSTGGMFNLNAKRQGTALTSPPCQPDSTSAAWLHSARQHFVLDLRAAPPNKHPRTPDIAGLTEARERQDVAVQTLSLCRMGA